MPTVKEVVDRLESLAAPANLAGMARYGMAVDRRLGVSMPELRRLAKEIGRRHDLALKLWNTDIAEARILASMVAVPEELSAGTMDNWVEGFDSWDVCDQVCQNLFENTPLALPKIREWAQRQEEFVRRAAFALIACLAWHDRTAPDRVFLEFLPLIAAGAADERNYVKKAVSWALRNIGKRNARLNRAAIQVGRRIQRQESRPARWIAADALRELESPAVRARLAKPGKATRRATRPL